MASVNIVEIDDSNYDEISQASGKLSVVDFWAAWCGPCRAIAPHLDRLADEYAGKITVGKVNVDNCRRIAEREGIVSIPNVMMFRDGVRVENIIGSQSYEDYKVAIDRHI